jgi:hypothetical protein
MDGPCPPRVQCRLGGGVQAAETGRCRLQSPPGPGPWHMTCELGVISVSAVCCCLQEVDHLELAGNQRHRYVKQQQQQGADGEPQWVVRYVNP